MNRSTRAAMAVALLTSLSLSGIAQTPAPTYDASFAVGDQIYTGSTTFQVDGKGVVTGTMKLTAPVEVNATLAGAVKSGTWTFEYPYQIPAQMCDGTVKGTAKGRLWRQVRHGRGHDRGRVHGNAAHRDVLLHPAREVGRGRRGRQSCLSSSRGWTPAARRAGIQIAAAASAARPAETVTYVIGSNGLTP
jgi:hypothetical protein